MTYSIINSMKEVCLSSIEVHVVVGMENEWLRSLHRKNRWASAIRGVSDSDVTDTMEDLIEKHHQQVLFHIKGGLIGYCVRRVAEFALDNGASGQINLMYCSIEAKDDVPNASRELLQRRQGELNFKMSSKYLTSSRLSVVQFNERGW